MKMIATLGDRSMTISSPDLETRPTIEGPLWEDFAGTASIEWWLDLFGQPRLHIWPEIDFALALGKRGAITTEWLEPIFETPTGDLVF